MNLKNVWLMLIVPMAAIVPFKIYSYFSKIPFVESPAFIIITGVILAAIMVFICFTKTHSKILDLNKNISLGISGLLVCTSFFWCITSYWNDTSKYEFEWQPAMLSIFAILSCISFLLIALTFFTGKNMLRSASFFIFCPVIWFIFSMIVFLSIYNNNPNIYEVALKSFLSLFLLYHTQIFSTFSNSNIVKLLYLFGIPSIVLACIKSLPILINALIGSVTTSNVVIVTAALEFSLAIYILCVLIESQMQSNKALETPDS